MFGLSESWLSIYGNNLPSEEKTTHISTMKFLSNTYSILYVKLEWQEEKAMRHTISTKPFAAKVILNR